MTAPQHVFQPQGPDGLANQVMEYVERRVLHSVVGGQGREFYSDASANVDVVAGSILAREVSAHTIQQINPHAGGDFFRKYSYHLANVVDGAIDPLDTIAGYRFTPDTLPAFGERPDLDTILRRSGARPNSPSMMALLLLSSLEDAYLVRYPYTKFNALNWKTIGESALPHLVNGISIISEQEPDDESA